MPYTWEAPDVYMVHNEVTVYHVYKSDDFEQGARTYWYGTSTQCSDSVGHGENGTFDVREFACEGDNIETDDGRKAIIRRAIDEGKLVDEDKDD